MAQSQPIDAIIYADDGHHALLETIKTPMYDADGKLIGVLGIGATIQGSRSWFQIGGLGLQPSEFAKQSGLNKRIAATNCGRFCSFSLVGN